MKGKCPRCNADAVELGRRPYQVGKTRKILAITSVCSSCDLVFAEKTKGEAKE